MPAPEGDEIAAEREDGCGVFLLRLHIGGSQVTERKPRTVGIGETAARTVAPLHGRASGVTPLVVGVEAHPERVAHVLVRHGDVGHADLVALVEHRCAAQRQQHEHGQADPGRIVFGPAGREAEHVVIGARPRRPGARRQCRLGLLDDGPHVGGLEGRADEIEVEGQTELVGPVAVELRQLFHRHRGLTDQEPGLLVGVGEHPPAFDHLVHLGPVGVVHAALPEHLRLEVVVLGRRRVVPELGVLDDDVGDVNAEPRHTPVGPEAEDVVERAAHLLVPPIEVWLFLQMVVEVVLARRLVQSPARSPEAADPVVRQLAVVLAVRPDVPVAVGRRP